MQCGLCEAEILFLIVLFKALKRKSIDLVLRGVKLLFSLMITEELMQMALQNEAGNTYLLSEIHIVVDVKKPQKNLTIVSGI
jgi:hypothetical protein